MGERNVLGGELEPCGTDPVTGFYRDGKCNTGAGDEGVHVICAEMTEEFLVRCAASASFYLEHIEKNLSLSQG